MGKISDALVSLLSGTPKGGEVEYSTIHQEEKTGTSSRRSQPDISHLHQTPPELEKQSTEAGTVRANVDQTETLQSQEASVAETEGAETKIRSDCLECKLVGGGALYACAAYCFNMSRKVPPHLQRKKYFYKLYTFGLGTVMVFLGTSRLFEFGIFSEKFLKRESFKEAMRDDWQDLKKTLGFVKEDR